MAYLQALMERRYDRDGCWLVGSDRVLLLNREENGKERYTLVSTT